jgi:hypothetical protein
MPIFRRKNCIHTASGIVALCKRLHGTPVESRFEPNLFPYHFLFLVSFYSHLLAYEDGADGVFRNVGI